MSCDHLNNCVRCSNQVEKLSKALTDAIAIIENKHGTPSVYELIEVLDVYGVDWED